MASCNTCGWRAMVTSTSCPASSARDGRTLSIESSLRERRRGLCFLAPAIAALALLFFVSGGSAEAHTSGTTGFAAVTVDRQSIRYSLSLTLEALEAAKTNSLGNSLDYDALADRVARHISISADGNPCESLPGIVQPP